MTPYVDLHCDALMKAWMHRKKDLYQLSAMASPQRLQAGGCSAQFFAIFMLPIAWRRWLGPLFPDDETYARQCLAIYEETIRRHSDLIAPAYCLQDWQQNRTAGKLSGFLTFEDGRVLNGSIETLEHYYQKGIRLISLTWNDENCLGAPNGSEKGLTDYGRDAVTRMNELGILVDVSHLSDAGFYEVAERSKSSGKPFVASHSNCRALNPHSRSMTDDMIRTLAECGGVMGVNFGPQFLTENTRQRESTIQQIAAQLRHRINIGGIECAAIGTDFDGISGRLEIANAGQMQHLFDALPHYGFTTSEIEYIAIQNVERVLADVMP